MCLEVIIGYSYLRSASIAPLVISRIPATFLLVLSAITIASTLGIFLEIFAASRFSSRELRAMHSLLLWSSTYPIPRY